MMKQVNPQAFQKRSSTYRQYADATFTQVAGGALPLTLPGDSRQQAEVSGLLDLSLLPRCGFRGANAAAYLQSQGLPVPSAPNQSSEGGQGELVLRLSQTEYWVLSGLDDRGMGVEALPLQSSPVACYPLYCQDSHAWFVMTGQHLANTLAKVCAVDLREAQFPLHAIAQTSVARVNAIVVSHQLRGLPAMSILSDNASAEYLWDALLDAMAEFGGQAIGMSVLGDKST